MSDSQKNPEIVPNKLMDLLVNDVFSKHGIDKEQIKGRLSEEKNKCSRKWSKIYQNEWMNLLSKQRIIVIKNKL